MQPYYIKSMSNDYSHLKNRVFVHFLLYGLNVEDFDKTMLRKLGEGYKYGNVSCKFFYINNILNGMYVKVKSTSRERDEFDHIYKKSDWLTYHVHLIKEDKETKVLVDKYYFSEKYFEKGNKSLKL